MLNVTNVTKKLGKFAAVNDPGISVAKGRRLELQAPTAQESPPLIAGLNSFEGDISFKDQNISGRKVDHAIRIDGLRGSHSIIGLR